MLVDLDAPSGRDPVRVGGKAATLAAARKIGAPVLPGFVVAGGASLHHMELGARALEQRGSGGARLAVSGEPIDFADELISIGASLGERLVARSSTLLESSPEWSGAFTSYLDIGPPELPKAVVGCWASAFSVAALERQEASGVAPGSFPMSVLVQPSLQPRAGGWAAMRSDGGVVVYGIEGSPSPLLQGWVGGEAARYEGAWSGDGLREMVGDETLEAIREMLDLVGEKMGSNRCEWALTDRIWGLQFGRAKEDGLPVVPPAALEVTSELAEVVRVVLLAPGALGDELVLPWALAGLPDCDVPTAPSGNHLIVRARELTHELTEEVWDLPWDRARQATAEVTAALRGTAPGSAIERLRRLRPANPTKAGRLIAMLRHIRDEACSRGLVADPSEAWYLSPDVIQAGFAGESISTEPRLGIGRWEPLVASVVLGSTPRPARGNPASPGVGAGLRVDLDHDYAGGSKRRGVLLAARPVPVLSPLLWDAAAVITRTGSPAAHVFEAARALRVPAVTDVDLTQLGGEIIAVDGTTGLVATMNLNREL